MKKILFICHGNICRSPMAEAIMQHLIKENGLENSYLAESKATTQDALGRSIDTRAQRELEKNRIPYDRSHRASQMNAADYDKYEYDRNGKHTKRKKESIFGEIFDMFGD